MIAYERQFHVAVVFRSIISVFAQRDRPLDVIVARLADGKRGRITAEFGFGRGYDVDDKFCHLENDEYWADEGQQAQLKRLQDSLPVLSGCDREWVLWRTLGPPWAIKWSLFACVDEARQATRKIRIGQSSHVGILHNDSLVRYRNIIWHFTGTVKLRAQILNISG